MLFQLGYTILVWVLSYLCYYSFILLYAIVTYLTYVSVYLVWRYFNVIHSSRIKPSGKKVVMISGSSSGMGLALAKHIYKQGFSVIATYHESKNSGFRELEILCHESNSRPSEHEISNGQKTNHSNKARIFLIQLDVRSHESIGKASEEVDRILDDNRLDFHCLINCAGMCPDGPSEWTSPNILRMVVETNLLGPILMCRAFSSKIIKYKGRVINISSGLHMIPFSSWPGYTCTKSGLTRFSEAFNFSIRRYGASCIAAMPGACFGATELAFKKAKYNDQSKAELSQDETQLHRHSIERYDKLINNLLEKVFLENGRNPDEIARQYGIKIPQSVKSPLGSTKRSSGRKISDKFTKILSNGSDFEISQQLLRVFDYGIQAKKPYTHIYPGNFTYSHFFGPLTNFVPQSIFTVIGLLIFERIIS